MSNRISPSLNRFMPVYPAAPTREAGPVREATGDAPRSPAPPSPDPLSAAERQMIDQYFPPSPRMTLRLYGPGRPTAVTPHGLGRRLDLRG